MTRSQDRFGGRFAQGARSVVSAIRSRYVVALAALGAALLLRYLFRDSLGLKVPYLLFYPAIILPRGRAGSVPASWSRSSRPWRRCTSCCRPSGLP